MDTTTSRQLPRDVFLYFLMIFALATSAVDLGTILFQFINLYIPGAAGYVLFGAQGAIRWAVSSLVIVFPVLVWVLWFLKRDMAAVPEKRDLKIRKWLLYLTLFITGLTVIGDLVTLVYTFMQGDITLRFILKVLVVFWLAGSIFYYFLKDLHDQSPLGRKIVAWVTIGIATAALIAGFVVAGSPASQRAQANDDRRVADLQSLENEIIMYWQAKNKLPASLADLPSGTIGGYVVPTDPLTGEPYVYTATGTLSYELCATFQMASQMDIGISRPYGVGVSSWQHESGYQCFDGKIDPDRVNLFAPKPL
jgi:hypothetical protein